MRPPPTIFRRLLTFVLAATLPLAAVIGYALRQQFQVDRDHALGQLRLLRDVNVRQLDIYLAGTMEKLRLLAADEPVVQRRRAQSEELFQRFVAFNPEFANVALLDQDGRVVAAANVKPINPQTSLLQFPQYKDALSHRSLVISHPYVRAIGKEWTCLFSYPVLAADGTQTGTLVAPINLLHFSQRLNFAPLLPRSSINVVDAGSGTIVMHLPDPGASVGSMLPDFAGLADAVAAGRGDSLDGRGPDGRPRTVSAIRLDGTPWLVCATAPTDGIFAPAWANFWRTLAGLALFLAAVVLLIWRYARGIERPVTALAAAARTQTPVADAPAAPAEIAETIEAFNAMLAARRDAEASLAASEHRYRTVIDQTGQMVYDFDFRHGRVAWFGGTAIEQITGYTVDEYNRLDLAGWEALLHPDDRDTAVRRLQNCVRTGESCHAEYRLRHKDGTYRYIEERGVVLTGADGTFVRMLGCMVDITARREAGRTLRETKAWLQSVIDTIDGIVWEVDVATMQFTFVSSQAERILGYPARQWIEEKDFWLNHMHPEDRKWAPEFCVVATRENRDHDFDYRMIAADGREVWLHDIVSLVRESDRVARLRGVMVDITERKHAAEEQARLERKLLETQKLERLGVLAGGIAHDFNNLLTTILGNANLAQMQIPPGQAGRDSLDQIEKASLRAADLCQQMLAYAGKGVLSTRVLDLNTLIRDITGLLEISVQRRAVLHLQLAGDLPAVNADATQVRQVIMNLVINAAEATAGGQGVIQLATGTLRATAEGLSVEQYQIEAPAGDYVWLQVTDNGAGMNRDTLSRIFDPFFTTKSTGSGLGLAAVLGIVRGHHGTIKVTSEPGRGTTFRILLPAVAAPAPAAPTPSGRPDAAWRGRGRLLVVDDESSVRLVLGQTLEHFGFDIVSACDGVEALQVFASAREPFAAVFLDLTMPRMNGAETFQRLRQLTPDVKVILMSGFNRTEATSRFTEQGFSGFIQKPFSVEALLTVLRRTLGT